MLRFTKGRLEITDGVTIAIPNGFWIEELWEVKFDGKTRRILI